MTMKPSITVLVPGVTAAAPLGLLLLSLAAVTSTTTAAFQPSFSTTFVARTIVNRPSCSYDYITGPTHHQQTALLKLQPPKTTAASSASSSSCLLFSTQPPSTNFNDDDDDTNAEDAAAASSSSTSTTSSTELPPALQSVMEKVPFKDTGSIKEYVETIISNISSGEFGSRGELYVAIQAILFAGVGFGGLPFLTGTLKVVFGPVALLAGLAVIVAGVVELGEALSPFPAPVENSSSNSKGLVKTGVYGYIRHPLYTGVLLAGTGWSVILDSALRMVFVVMVLVLFLAKTEYEETELTKVFPDYDDYKQTTGKFLPKQVLDNLPF